jgi:hypothetical protein
MLAEIKTLVAIMSELYQIYFPDGIVPKEEQRKKILPVAIPYFNEHLTIFFESEVIRKLVMASKADKIGVCSWKLEEKMHRRVGLRQPLTQEAIDGDYNILSFTRNSQRHSMLAMANTWHGDFVPTMKLLWGKLGYKMPGEAKNPIYQNAYCAKIEVYRDYVTNFLIPAMELTEKDEEMHQKMIQPSGYARLQRGCDIKRVKKELNMDDYPLSTFILERCPALYYQMKGVQISYL